MQLKATILHDQAKGQYIAFTPHINAVNGRGPTKEKANLSDLPLIVNIDKVEDLSDLPITSKSAILTTSNETLCQVTRLVIRFGRKNLSAKDVKY